LPPWSVSFGQRSLKKRRKAGQRVRGRGWDGVVFRVYDQFHLTSEASAKTSDYQITSGKNAYAGTNAMPEKVPCRAHSYERPKAKAKRRAGSQVDDTDAADAVSDEQLAILIYPNGNPRIITGSRVLVHRYRSAVSGVHICINKLQDFELGDTVRTVTSLPSFSLKYVRNHVHISASARQHNWCVIEYNQRLLAQCFVTFNSVTNTAAQTGVTLVSKFAKVRLVFASVQCHCASGRCDMCT
jgi:hypothetical protein